MGLKKAAFIVMILLASMFAFSAAGSPVRAIGVTGTITVGASDQFMIRAKVRYSKTLATKL